MIKDLDSIPLAYRDFVNEFESMQGICVKDSHAKGFDLPVSVDTDVVKIALMHTELSEAVEALRHGNPPDDKIPAFSGVEAELADAVIRIMDFAGGRDLRLGEAIVHKLLYNRTRLRHGKQF